MNPTCRNTAAPSTGRRWSRVLLCGPIAFVLSVALMAASSVWLPKGAAGIDNLVVPVVLFPAIWATLFFYTLLDRRLARAWLVALLLSVVSAMSIAPQFLGDDPENPPTVPMENAS